MSKSPPKKKLTLAEFETTERGMLWAIADFTSDQLVSVYSESLGVKAPEAAYRSALVARESTRLTGEQYLLNAKRSTLEIGLALGMFGYNSGFHVKGALSANAICRRRMRRSSVKPSNCRVAVEFFGRDCGVIERGGLVMTVPMSQRRSLEKGRRYA